MSYILKVGELAQKEIDETFTYYYNIQTKLGVRFIETLEAIFDRIANNPFQFPQYQTPYREAFMIKFPYIIVFEVEQSEVILFGIFHASRNPDDKFKNTKI